MTYKIAMFTDIHFGKKQNSQLFNSDCLDFVKWFASEVKKDKDIKEIAFLGDFFESRSSISIQTLDFGYNALKILNDLGIPIRFIVGNHDLHRRSTREIYSTAVFSELHNVHVINEIVTTENRTFCPYLFEDEYKNVPITDYIFGHFSFKGFIITGYNTMMTHGHEHLIYKDAKRILSGHFHKRQALNNCVYIGNTHPMDYGDANDMNRGMAIIDIETNNLEFKNWEQCPKYFRTCLTDVIDGSFTFYSKSYIKCQVDEPLAYSEIQLIRESMIEEYSLREFIMEESKQMKSILSETQTSDEEFSSIDETVVNLLSSIKNDSLYRCDELVKIYQELESE